MEAQGQPLRTAVYIDGYNLYYGRLRGSSYKWLDVVGLFRHIVHTIEPASCVQAVRYFTAPALAKFARHGEREQFILVSNDSDAEPVLEALTEDFPALRIGIVMPVRPPDPGRRGRPISVSLSRFAHWTRDYIRDDELAQFQLPESVPTRKRPARKPAHW
jgi:hypothetical protein